MYKFNIGDKIAYKHKNQWKIGTIIGNHAKVYGLERSKKDPDCYSMWINHCHLKDYKVKLLERKG